MDGADLDAPRLVYWPVRLESFNGQPKFAMPAIAYVVRSERAGTASFAAEINRAVWEVNADLPVFSALSRGWRSAASSGS